MTNIFLKIINMSISASYIVLAVLLLRLLLKKAPKWITVILWGIVAVRLICPFSIESVLSLIPSSEVISPDIMMDRTPEINTGIPIVNQVVNPIIGNSFTPNPGTSANPLQLWIPTFTLFWLVGILALLIYTAISYLRVRRKIGTAVLYKDNIYQSENVVSPFVLGLFKPKIYLPFHMNEKDMEHVVAHEMAHIRRKDHLWKPLGFLLLTLHWFNPLLWLGYVLLCRDIELACDEKVIGELDHNARADYSEALLSCSVNRRMLAACPLAFGEVGVKERVKAVLHYKKPAFWIIMAAMVACVAIALCFLTNPPTKEDERVLNPHGEIYTDYKGVYITLKSIDTNAGGHKVLNTVWHNESDVEVMYGEMFSIEYKIGDEWTSTAVKELNFHAIGYLLRSNSTDHKSYSTQWFDISKNGTYRLKVPFSVKENNGYQKYHTWLEFDLKNISYEDSQNLIYGFVPPAGDSDKLSYVYIQDYGCDVKDVDIEFKSTRFEQGNIVFDILWRNDGTENVDIGPNFEVYKDNGSSYEKLEHKGIWLLYQQILAGKGMNVAGDNDTVRLDYENTASYNLSYHYEVLTPGNYRFEAHGAWVDFQILGDGFSQKQEEQPYEVPTVVFPDADAHIFFEPRYCETFFVENDTAWGGFYYHRYFKKCTECGEVLESADIYRCQINHSLCEGDCYLR